MGRVAAAEGIQPVKIAAAIQEILHRFAVTFGQFSLYKKVGQVARQDIMFPPVKVGLSWKKSHC